MEGLRGEIVRLVGCLRERDSRIPQATISKSFFYCGSQDTRSYRIIGFCKLNSWLLILATQSEN